MRRTTLGVLAGYIILAVAMTWPLVVDLGRRLPYDLGDPLLNCWILAWQIAQFGRLLHGDVAVLADWWHGNIFYPSPYTLGMSEVLLVPALLGWPVLALTGNVILTYNLLFLGSFVLSGLFMFLFVRELTGSASGAWVAGLLFAFAPFRFDHGSHLQAQFAFWMPLVLWQIDRFARDGRARQAVAAGLALTALNLSNGYYLFFFAPWVVAFSLFALWRHGQLRARDRWRGLVLTAGLSLLTTAPGLIPYIALRRLGAQGRSLDWVERYSAIPASWMTATPWLRVWGDWLVAAPRPENFLFPGAVPIVLLVAACLLAFRHLTGAERRILAMAVASVAAGIWWSFGPTVVIAGTSLPSLYHVFYQWVPGFDALRAPSRVAIIVALWTSVTAALAVAGMLRGSWLAARPGARGVALALTSLLVLGDAAVVPLRMHEVLHAPHYRAQSPEIEPNPGRSPLARQIARLPADAVLVELPFGALPLEVRYMYTSIGHWRRMVNGYSGEFPDLYLHWQRVFGSLPNGGDEAARGLHDSGATHVVLHAQYYGPERTAKLRGWLLTLGSTQVAQVGEEFIYALPWPPGPRRPSSAR